MGKTHNKSSLAGASPRWRAWGKHISGLVLGLMAVAAVSSSAAAFDLHYGGRLADPSGAPLAGPVHITFRFYRDVSGGTALVTVQAPRVTLVDGMFSAPIPLSANEVELLFDDGDRAVYIEVESQGTIYPRQMFSHVPLALRVPVDGTKIVYNGDGKLTLGPDAMIGVATLNAKQDAIGSSSVLDAGTFSSNFQNALEINPYSSEAGNTGELRFRDLTTDNSHYVGFKAPDAALSTTIWTLPSADGSGGYVLSTNGSGTLSWISPATGTITSLATGTGLTGGPIVGVGTISLADVGTPGTYTKITTNDQGQVISGGSLGESDIPALSAAKIVSGLLPVDRGGTGAATFANHGVLVGSGALPISTAAPTTSHQVLRAGADGAPAFGAISLNQSAAVTGVLPLTSGGTGAATAEAARTNLGLGSAAILEAGTAANNVVTLESGAKLPAVDASQLMGVVKSTGDSMTGPLSLPSNGLTVGSNQMVVSGGKVGIGTTDPVSTLQVKGQFTTVLPNELTPTGTNQAIDFATGNMQMVNLSSASGDVTLTLSNPVAGGSYAIKFIQGATARAVIWPANVKWPEGNVMALSTVSGAIDLVTLFYDGTAYLAVGGRNFY